MPFIPFISNAVAAAIAAVAVSTAAAVAVETFPKVVDDVGRWFGNRESYYTPADYSPVHTPADNTLLLEELKAQLWLT
ncbi:hypothetical protein [Mesomycoplasma ovipneumoniae]|uniref:hypothetical protein n=1 Tax=Mesomycoplasma ovipneumoniae TaxID=29562 RepID=UPI0029645616|nr:hypothetical protein [Mesomycoplasma ovipneumoniae]MDW2860887.1 hypothetical protein [Mesomycoplasma ovipneumoniae]